MSRWPLRAVALVRSMEARAAAREAAMRGREAARLAEAAEQALRGLEGARLRASGEGPGPRAGIALRSTEARSSWELRIGAARRSEFDRLARQAAEDAARAAKAARMGVREHAASLEHHAIRRARADALDRQEQRWMDSLRRARDAHEEREAEESSRFPT